MENVHEHENARNHNGSRAAECSMVDGGFIRKHRYEVTFRCEAEDEKWTAAYWIEVINGELWMFETMP
jgi:hypothetical protein